VTGRFPKHPVINLRIRYSTVLDNIGLDAGSVVKWKMKGNKRYVEKFKWSIKVLMCCRKLCKVSVSLVSPFILRIYAHIPLHQAWGTSSNKKSLISSIMFARLCCDFARKFSCLFETISPHIGTPCSRTHLKNRTVVQSITYISRLIQSII